MCIASVDAFGLLFKMTNREEIMGFFDFVEHIGKQLFVGVGVKDPDFIHLDPKTLIPLV